MQYLRLHRRTLLGIAILAGVLPSGCSEGTVSAPQGGSIVLEASPAAIGLGGTSRITALVRDQNGDPVREDVEVLFFTDLGDIDRAAVTSSRGLATATLTAGNTPGSATVRAVAGPNEGQITVPIGAQVGGITLQADPEQIASDTGGEIDLVAAVRDSGGDPLAGAPVTFSTPLGSFESGSGTDTVSTDESGEARNTVTVTAEEAGSWGSPSFTITATTPGPDGEDLFHEAVIGIDADTGAPVAQFTAEPAGGKSVQFRNASTGEAPLVYEWDFGDGGTSALEEPLHTYGAAGQYTVKLTVSNGVGTNETSQTITVPVT